MSKEIKAAQEVVDKLQEVAKQTGYTFSFEDVDISMEDKTFIIKGNQNEKKEQE